MQTRRDLLKALAATLTVWPPQPPVFNSGLLGV